jgi:1,4-dihydroxy-2-naphthoate octaprenyltransferase
MKPGSGISVKNLIRAMRLPFVSASALPFIFGSLLNKDGFNVLNFLLGLIGVVATHLSANLINDYADSKSGRDWQDKKYYGLFGGSKLIQEGVLSELFYFKLAVLFLVVAGTCLLMLAFTLHSMLIIQFFLVIVILSWAYSQKPFRLSYRMAGEPVIFLLFGPALVMGGYFIQNEIFPDARSFILSLPFGFLTTALLFINEVPDAEADATVGKKTWVALTGKQNAYIVYAILVLFAFFYIAVSMALGYVKWPAVFVFAAALCCIKAFMILKKDYGNKDRLLAASRLTIIGLVIMNVVLILDILFFT